MVRALRRLDWLDRIALSLVVAWEIWVLTSGALNGHLEPSGLAFHVVPPLVAAFGVVVGRSLARHSDNWPVAESLLAISLLFVLSALLTGGPGKWPTRYDNANSAVGVQLVALVALAALDHRRVRSEDERRWGRRETVLVTAGLAAVAVVAVNASQAGLAVAVPVTAAALISVVFRRGPWRPVSVALGLVAIAAGASLLWWLASLPEWPTVVLRALTRVRQQLWRDALSLWDSRQVTGAAPGSFRQASSLAADPDTATAHSSILQIAAELGDVGLGLFAALLIVGLLLAARRSRPAALIAVAAWTGLAVHSFMDHLYEFSAVTLAAAAVLGWASAGQNSSTSPRVSAQASGGGGAEASGRVVNSGP